VEPSAKGRRYPRAVTAPQKDAEMSDMHEQLGQLSVAIFGHPDLREDGGIVGDIKAVRTSVEGVHRRLDSLIVGFFSVFGIGVLTVLGGLLSGVVRIHA
jgi:hypothetical protein